ncbi:Protein gp31 of His2 family of spindle-shaped halovirus [Methanonatronarchaeum thermophilum]|uniref:Protein gp31 of His2 family of spindle-shaped halovirus n=1 Tax=Methanonatronarchaeum thermophilum TaxID=1927129 RepID=A0A1Y3GB17_9EURY|nr:hypothetical protein [Methanonatronarchaeum thermophilum]OUJ18599.1 Protein gp31 of His2 family of spindle-shaped halovirus [Methanonatronarchaeum thermophilum]
MGPPQYITVFYLTLLIGSLITVIPATKLIDWLIEPQNKYILQLGMEKGDLGLWKLQNHQHQEIKVIEGSLHREKTSKAELIICQKFDPKTMEAVGTWRGSVSNIELLRNKEQIKEIRKHLEKMAQKGIKTRIRMPSMVRDAVNQITMEMAAHIERETIYNGEIVNQIVERTIKEIENENNSHKQTNNQTDRPQEG